VCSGGTGVFQLGLFRVRHIVCGVRKEFENNGKLYFDPKVNRKFIQQLKDSGKSLDDFQKSFESGFLSFPTEDEKGIEERVGGYKTGFGPIFFSGALCYTKESLVNLSKAMTRLTCKRKVEQPGLCDELRHNQEKVFSEPSPWLTAWKKYFAWLRGRVVNSVNHELGEHFDVIKVDAERVHAKRALRVRSLFELVRDGVLLTYEFMKTVTGKVKCPEWAKPGKYPRMIGDYTCPGSLLGGALAACVKACFTAWYETIHMKMRFVYSASYDVLVECYTELLKDSGPSVFVYHSDDMCCNIKCVDGRARFNVDISSCDASNGWRIFQCLTDLVFGTYWYPIFMKCVEQCMKPLTIRNPLNVREKVVLSNGGEPIEYSGTVLTTLLNNIAMSAICIAISLAARGMRVADMKGAIEYAASTVGYIVTVDVVEKVEDFQFLKTSPTYDGSKLGVFVNLGVLLRSLGWCDGDLPGRGSTAKRAERRNSEIVEGMKHVGSNIIVNALRARFPPCGTSVSAHYLIEQLEGFTDQKVSISALCRRYNLEPGQFEFLAREISTSKVGDVITNDALRAIFKTDYGL